jgi:nitrous oxidase accessory protein NosD
MRNGSLQKGLVTGITLLFIVTTFVPSINGSQSQLEKSVFKSQNQITFENTNFNNDFNIPRPLNLSDGLVGYWNFNEGTGSIAHDLSGYGNDGKIFGNAIWTTGRSGYALSFDGVDDWIDCGNDASLNPSTAITLAAWYKPTIPWVGAGNDPIIDKSHTLQSYLEYQYHLGVCGNQYEGSNPLALSFDITSGGTYYWIGSPANSVSFDQWSFIVGTYDGSTMKLYIDDVMKSSQIASGTLSNNGQNLSIAKYIINSGYEKFLPGIIDEVRIFNRALTEDEIHQLFIPSTVYVDDDFNSSSQGWGYDHFSTIQAGIDAVDVCGTVFVYDGIYYESVILNKNGINLLGADKNTTIIDAHEAGHGIHISAACQYINISQFTVRNANGSGIIFMDPTHGTSVLYNTISNCIVYNSSTDNSDPNLVEGFGIYLGGHDAHLQYNTIINCETYNNDRSGIIISRSAYDDMTNNRIINCKSFNNGFESVGYDLTKAGIAITDHNHFIYNTLISECEIYNNAGDGICCGNSGSGTHIIGNTIYNNSWYGINFSGTNHNELIYRNNFITNHRNNAYDGGINTWYNTTLHEGNYWSDYTGIDVDGDGIGDTPYIIPGGSNQDLYPLMYPWDSEPIPPLDCYIDDDYNEATPGWGYDHFSSIQDGIDAVYVGGTVFVYNGNYTESLEPDNEYIRIEKSITLKGENKTSTIINCPAGETGIMISTTWVGVKNVNISGFTVQGANQIAIGIYSNPFCTNLTIENCIVHSFSEGISCRIGAKNVTIKNCTSFNNNREGGICFLETGYQNISISNCISYNNTGCGIDIKNCNYGIGILSNNSCFNNVEDGIYLRSSNFISISNCTSYSNGQSGLQIYNRNQDGDSGAENNIVQNSTFYNNSWHGISIYGWGNFQNNDIINCDCIENDLYGIAIDGGFVAGSQIFNCTSSSNGMDGIILNCEGQDMQLVKNICSNNSGSGITICGNQNLVKENIVTDNNGYGIIFRNHTAFENPPCNNIIYYNNLINNYQNAYDNGSNFWYNNNSQEGNYYDDYTGQDNDADAIGDMPYSIAGGVNQDFYPLMTPFGPPHANFTSINNDKIVTFNASISYDYDGSIISYEWDFGDGTNATGIYISHTFSQYETYNVTLTVFDNDGKQDSFTEPIIICDIIPPEIIDNSPSNAYTGDSFTFNATITDNDAVDVAFVYFHYNTGDMIVAPLTNTNGDYWEATITIENILGFMGYYIATSDVSGNFYSTEPISILIIDNDFPSFTDNSPSSGTTGDLYTFDIAASDNLGISCIMASWDHGSQSGFNIPLNNDDDGTWSLPITIDQDLNPLLYNITVIDISNNIVIGPPQTIPIMDNDFPMVVDNTPSIGYAGQNFTFNATATDNIDVSIVHVEYWFDNGTHSSVNLENVAGDYYQGTTYNTIPLSCVILHYIITVEDTSGNSVSTGTISVIIIPDTPPTAPIINGPTSGNTGEIYTYTFVAIDPNNDNIYYEINWGDGQVDDWYGPCTSNLVITRTHQWAEKGTYLIQARAKDIYGAIGNWGSLSVTMPTEIVVHYQSSYQITSFQLKKIMS